MTVGVGVSVGVGVGVEVGVTVEVGIVVFVDRGVGGGGAVAASVGISSLELQETRSVKRVRKSRVGQRPIRFIIHATSNASLRRIIHPAANLSERPMSYSLIT